MKFPPNSEISLCFDIYVLFNGPFQIKMSTIESLGVKEEIKNILDSGGFLRDVQKYLETHFPRRSRGISKRSVRRYCQRNGLRRFSAKKLDKKEKENAVKRAAKEVHSMFKYIFVL
jgi:hypothetical protein